MKKIFCLLSITPIFFICAAQLTVDTTIKLDLLKAPVSPAFNILGIASSDIERPTDVTSFALSLRDATNNFTAIPKSYAFEVAPFLLSVKKFTLDDFDNNKYSFKQSFIISAGFTHTGPKGKEEVDSLKTTKTGFGIKFSIIRPRWSDETRNAYTNLIIEQKKLLHDFEKASLQNKRYSLLLAKRIEQRELEYDANYDKNKRKKLVREIDSLEILINEDVNKKFATTSIAYQAVKKIATAFKTERKGFFLDFAGGFALDFPDNRFDNCNAYRGGGWLTGGMENGNKGITSMFIARYLYNPKTIFADAAGILKDDKYSIFDAGARFLFNAVQGKLCISTEGIYRSVLNTDKISPSWRLVLNTEYTIGINKVLTFSFGRDFNGTISKGGNLISAINFITGFGGERKISK